MSAVAKDKPPIGVLLQLNPKGAKSPPKGVSSRRQRTQKALEAAWDASQKGDKDGFMDAMEGAINFAQAPDEE